MLVTLAGCFKPQPSTITLGPNRELLIHALVNYKRLTLQLDTGASTTSLTPTARHLLQLWQSLPRIGRDAGLVRGAGGEIGRVEYVGVASMRLGSTVIRGVPAAVLDRGDGNEIDGLLGMDVLGRYVLEVDLRAHRYALHRKAAGLVSPDLVAVDYTPLIGAQIALPILVNGRPATAVFDLGASRTFANRRVGLTPDDEHTTITAVIGSDGNRLTFRPASDVRIGFGELALRAPSVWINDLPIFHTLGLADRPALILGTDALAGRRIVIDPFARRVYVSRAQ
jgi:hypothetical protein